MNKKNIVFILTLMIYSTIITILLINQHERTQSLTQTIKGSEIGYLHRIEEITNKYNSIMDINSLLYEGQEEFGETNEALQKENLKLIVQIEDITNIDASSIEWLKHKGIDDYSIISDNLIIHPELIPFEGVLGGTMFFTKAFVLNNNWVYARFEDGHVQGYGIFKYEFEKDMNITWKVVDAFLDGDDRN